MIPLTESLFQWYLLPGLYLCFQDDSHDDTNRDGPDYKQPVRAPVYSIRRQPTPEVSTLLHLETVHSRGKHSTPSADSPLPR